MTSVLCRLPLKYEHMGAVLWCGQCDACGGVVVRCGGQVV